MTKVLEALLKALPVALVRLLLLAVVLGAAAAHLTATRRIEVLERGQDRLEDRFKTQNEHVLAALGELKSEVRGYRDDIREENKTLKARRRGQAGE